MEERGGDHDVDRLVICCGVVLMNNAAGRGREKKIKREKNEKRANRETLQGNQMSDAIREDGVPSDAFSEEGKTRRI